MAATTELGACEWFVWDLQRSGLIDRGQLDQILGDYLKRNPRSEPQQLAEFLVEHEVLTELQAERLLAGKTQGLVLGPYVLMESVGTGSMGQVYKALSKSDNQYYALKVLPRRSMWNVRLARRQVRSFTQISHPSVVPFVDVGTSGGLHYLCWPFVQGHSLDELVQRQGKLPPEQTAQLGYQLAQALNVCHQRDLFHGLLKPSNVMVADEGQALILDFGIGSLLVENESESLVDTMSTANSLTSGLDCASPESIVDPSARTPAGDQYSLGCTLYFCLTGQFPFPNGTAVEKMMAHQSKEPTAVLELCPDCPPNLAGAIHRLMNKQPEERFNGMDEVVEELEPLAGDVTAFKSAKPVRPASRDSKYGATPARPPQSKPQRPSRVTPPPPPAYDDGQVDFGNLAEAVELPEDDVFQGQPALAQESPRRISGEFRPPSRQSDPDRRSATVDLMPAQSQGGRQTMASESGQRRRPGGWVPEEPKSYQLGQTALIVVTLAVIVGVWFAASRFFFGG